MSDLIKRVKIFQKFLKEIRDSLQISPDAIDEPEEIDLLLDALVARIIELEAQAEWEMADTLPKESGDYLCAMMDGRDDCDDEWFEVVNFKVSKDFKSHWMTCNFDEVVRWKPITPPEGEANDK